MSKTVLCHFYNEEWLLPWWLRHHRAIFDHGIMIDYASTDRSCEIIRDLCPGWEIRPSRNQFFDSVPIDKEVMDVERELTGWRMTLNVTEFLYGNTDYLTDTTTNTQYLLGNYVFVDMKEDTKGATNLDYNKPLHEQRYWGHDNFENSGQHQGGVLSRMNRSIHNYPIIYPTGRHFGGGYRTKDDPMHKSFDDLVIFYYGWIDDSGPGMARKLQIKNKTSENITTHHHSQKVFEQAFNYHRSISRDLTGEIVDIIKDNKRCTGQEW